MDQEEAYVLSTGPNQYHIIVDNCLMFTTEIINVFCYYFVLNISYPKTMHALYIMFFQNYVFNLPTKSLSTSVISFCPSSEQLYI